MNRRDTPNVKVTQKWNFELQVVIGGGGGIRMVIPIDIIHIKYNVPADTGFQVLLKNFNS